MKKMAHSQANHRVKTDEEKKQNRAGVTMTESKSLIQPLRAECPEVKAAIERGLADVAAGRVRTRRSYAEYATIETED